MSTSALLWNPSPERARQSQMHAFMTRIAQRHGVAADWEALRRWSIDKPDAFWSELVDYAGVRPSRPADRIMTGDGMLGTKWFDGMTLNYARHMLRFDDDGDALLYENEIGGSARYSHRELRRAVAGFAAALRKDGVRRGDRVAGFMPNMPETVIAMLAAASLGAIWSSCSPDFGVDGVLDRFGQIEPTVLVVADQYSYGGKRFDSWSRAAEMLPKLPSVRRVVVVSYDDAPTSEADRGKIAAAISATGVPWQDYVRGAGGGDAELTFEEVPFDHPLFIMYSSGTTGVPKCIVHGHGGTLLQHIKELTLHCDLRAGERIFYFTTCGWMMWNWLVSGLGVGAAVVLYEGNPAYPSTDRLWKLAEERRVDVFGASAKFIAACHKADLHPGRDHDLSRLRCICSTGSPLSVELFHWVYDAVKTDLQLSSISGGTDIISCFMLGNPVLPVYAGEIQCRGLGMDVQAWDENARPVVGQKGELVCCRPFPCQPVGFWNDPTGEKYRSAYFDFYPDVCVWRHGDFIEITPTGGVIVYGRSDATLNPGGVRIGTAEIYRVVEGMEEIVDSVVVGKDAPDQDVDVVLFVVLRTGVKLDAALEGKLRKAIAEGATKRHVPKYIRQVSAIPYTISGKKVEMAVRRVIHGLDVPNRDALANPQALEEYRSAL